MITTKTIEVVGAAGSLGGKLGVQVCSRFSKVYTFDIAKTKKIAQTGIDPRLASSTVINRSVPATTLGEVLERCDVIHWAAPIDTVRSIPRLPSSSLLVLHDSVMSNSVETARELIKREEIDGKIAIAHCLMYDSRAVAVATDISETDRLIQHITDLGLHPEPMTSDEHDDIMAYEHGYWAVICKIFRPKLEEYERRRLLTPSAKKFLEAMRDNESHWTGVSYKAIVSNPKLESVARSVHEKVKNGQHR